MSVHALTQVDPSQLFRLPSTNSTGTQRLDTQVSGVAVSNDFSGRLSVTTAEGDTITLSADLESDFRAVHDTSYIEGNGTTVDVDATYAEYSLKREFGVTIEGDLNEEEVKDLARLFGKVANIFKQYLSGQDDEALAKTAKLVERFGNLPSLSGLDLSVDVERSVTVLAAQVASEVTGRPALPIDRLPQTPVTTTHTVTPGGAPSTAAAIPQPSTGTTAPTLLSTAVPIERSTDAAHLSTPVQETQRSTSLVEQVLDALKEVKVELHKVQKYLPDFFEKLRDDLVKELRGEREHAGGGHDQLANQVQTPATTSISVVFAYQTVSQTSVSLSIHS